MDEQKITKLATFFEEIKRLILNGSKEIDEEDEKLSEFEYARKYSKTNSMAQE